MSYIVARYDGTHEDYIAYIDDRYFQITWTPNINDAYLFGLDRADQARERDNRYILHVSDNVQTLEDTLNYDNAPAYEHYANDVSAYLQQLDDFASSIRQRPTSFQQLSSMMLDACALLGRAYYLLRGIYIDVLVEHTNKSAVEIKDK